MVAMARHPWRTRLLAALILSLLPLAGAAAQAGGGSIRGIVFLDENEDGVWRAGEAPLEGVAIMISDGEQIIQLLSGSDGSFRTNVPEGEWQGVVMPPEGYLPTNDATRNVRISAEEVLEAVMDFGLIGVSSGESDSAGPAQQGLGAGPESEGQEETPEASPMIQEQGHGAQGLAETVGGSAEVGQVDAEGARTEGVPPFSGPSRPPLLLLAGIGLASAVGTGLIWIARRIR